MATNSHPTDFKTFYRSLTKEQKTEFASDVGTTNRYIETHLVYARKIPGPKLMERIYAACIKFGADFSKADLIAFFYEPNKDREVKCGTTDRAASSDDVQPPVGGSSGKEKMAPVFS